MRVVAFSAAGVGLAWAVERWLGARQRVGDGDPVPDPIRSTIEIGAPIEQGRRA